VKEFLGKGGRFIGGAVIVILVPGEGFVVPIVVGAVYHGV
jgi:hypothetical protein